MDIKQILISALGPTGFNEYESYFMTHCIFPEKHNNGDRNPSLKISKRTGVFYCLGCHAKGSFQKFISHFPQLHIPTESLEFFLHLAEAQRHGKSESTSEPCWDSITVDIEGNIQEVYDIPEAAEYARARGVTEECIEYFEIKATRKAIINGTLFQDRLLIPMFHSGRMVNLEGRDFLRTQRIKVLYPKKGITNIIMNFDDVDSNMPLHIVEGIMDVVKIFPFTKNVRPLLGSSLKAYQKKQLHAFIDQGGSIILWPDHDNSGRAIPKQFSNAGIPYSIAPYPEERNDPGECTPSEIKKALENPVSPTQSLIKEYGVFSPNFSWSNL